MGIVQNCHSQKLLSSFGHEKRLGVVFSLSTLPSFHSIMINEHKNRAHFMSAPCSKLLHFTRPLIIVLILLSFSRPYYGRGLLGLPVLKVQNYYCPRGNSVNLKPVSTSSGAPLLWITSVAMSANVPIGICRTKPSPGSRYTSNRGRLGTDARVA